MNINSKFIITKNKKLTLLKKCVNLVCMWVILYIYIKLKDKHFSHYYNSSFNIYIINYI